MPAESRGLPDGNGSRVLMSMTMGEECGKSEKGSEGTKHAAKRLNGKIDAQEFCDLRRPCTSGVDDCAR